MTPASSITIAAIFTAGLAASVAAAPGEPRPAARASAVSSSALPSCSADGKRSRQFIGGKGFWGDSASGMYGQVFFASGGGSRAAFSESNSRGGRFSSDPGNGNGNANGHQDSPGANAPGRGSNASDGAAFGQGRGNALVRDAGVGAVVNPEPGTLLLIGAGLGAMAFRRRRQARKNQGL